MFQKNQNSNSSMTNGSTPLTVNTNITSNFLKNIKSQQAFTASTDELLKLKKKNFRTLIIIFSSLDEFESEREVLHNSLLPELQQYCSDRDVDLECVMLYEKMDIMQNVKQISLLSHLIKESITTYTLCFIGDKYGDNMLPVELKIDEYNEIQTSALEISAEVQLLEQFYTLKKKKDSSYYRLKSIETQVIDPALPRKLCNLMQKSLKEVVDSKQSFQVNENNYKSFFKSFIELIIEILLDNTKKNIIVTRKLTGFPNYNVDNIYNQWIDLSNDNYERITLLKNQISNIYCQQNENNYFPFIFNLNNSTGTNWIDSKDFSTYKHQLVQKLGDRLKQLFKISSEQCPTEFSLTQLINNEDNIHCSILKKNTPINWVERANIDKKLNEIVTNIFNGISCYVQFYGDVGIGKTATLCRLYQLIQQKIDDSTLLQSTTPIINKSNTNMTINKNFVANTLPSKQIILLLRFVTLTESSVFANEIFRNLFLKVFELGNIPFEQNKMIESFYLKDILFQIKQFISILNYPVIILIDDAHLIRYGNMLSRLEKPILETLGDYFSIIVFSGNSTPISGLPPMPELVKISAPNQIVSLSILKNRCQQLWKKIPDTNQMETLRQNMNIMTKKSSTNLTSKKKKFIETEQHLSLSTNIFNNMNSDINCGNLIMGEIQCEELLFDEQLVVSRNFDERFAHIEMCCGIENTRLVAQLLCSCSSFGITKLELLDGFRLYKRVSNMSLSLDDIMCANALIVLKHFGCLVRCVQVNNRCLWFFSYNSILRFACQRYMRSVNEIRLIYETLANIMKYPQFLENDKNNIATSCLLFPQPINRENGAVNLRRVRFHWYYLLYSGNIEQLKSLTLCSFKYLESVFRGCGFSHLLTMFEECLLQILDHDILVIFEQVLLPIIPTLIRDNKQFVSEFLNRLRYTRSKNSTYLNNIVEQAMQWTDNYNKGSLLVPLTCWISPPKMKEVLSFNIPNWKSSKTIIQPTFNHQHLLVAGDDESLSEIYMFHIASQLLFKTFIGHESRISSICISSDGNFFVTSDYNGNLKIWNFFNEECVKTLKITTVRILCLLLSADDKWVITGSVDSAARVINIENGIILKTFKDHTGPVVGLQLSSDNELLITGSGDFVVMVWNIESSTIILKMGGLMAPVTCLAITSNDAFLAVACEDETLRVFSMVSSQELHEFSGHDSRVNSLVVSSDDCQLFAATYGKVLIYDIHNGQLLEILNCLHFLPVTCLKISNDNAFVFAACGDFIHMWNMNSIEHETLNNDQSTLACICMSPDEKSAGCGTIDGIIAFWDLDVCQCLWTTSQQKSGAITALNFTINSLYLLSGNVQGEILMWEVSTGQLLKQLQVHNGSEVITICCFSDGFRVLSIDKLLQAQLWSLLSYMEEGILNNFNSGNIIGQVGYFTTNATGNNNFYGPGTIQVGNNVRASSFSNDDLLATIPDLKPPVFARYSASTETYIVVGHHARKCKEVNIWTVSNENRIVLKAKAYHNQDIICYNLNKFASILVTGSLDHSLKIWQIDFGFLTQVLVGHTDIITCCCISEDGKFVVSSALNLQIIVWDVETGVINRSIKTTLVLSFMEISQDSTVFITADKNGWIEAWETENGKLLSSFNTHRCVQQLIMSVDGNRILMRLSQTAQLPILCLHNTPATLVPLTSFPHSINISMERKNSQCSWNHSLLQSTSSFTSDFISKEDGFQRLSSKSKNFSVTTGIRSDSVPSTKSKRYNKDILSSTNNSEVNTYKKISKIDSGINNSVVKNNTNTSNRKSNMCLIL